MMIDTSNVVVPNQFSCPIECELMIKPVKANCGHIFENLALISWLATNSTCPLCRSHITKVVYDKKLAKEIKEKFVDISEANKQYFENVKKELDEDISYLPFRGNELLEAKGIFENVQDYLSRFVNHPIQTVNETITPELEVNTCINNDDLERAERITNRGFYFDIFSYTQKCCYKKIVESYIRRNYSNSNLQNAIRLINKKNSHNNDHFIMHEKDILWKNIYQKYFDNDNLKMAQYVADKLLNDTALLKDIYQKYFDNNDLKSAESLAETLPNNSHLLENIFQKHLDNDDLKNAESLAGKIQNDYNYTYTIGLGSNRDSSHYNKILNAYINRKYSDANLKEAKRLVSTKINYHIYKDGCYSQIAKVYAENEKYSEAYDSAKNISHDFYRWFVHVHISTIAKWKFFKTKISNAFKTIKNFVTKTKA